MLYLMHVPWGYIKQRPHFLGEYLNGIFDVTIYCLRHTQTRKLADNKLPDNINVNTLWVSNLPRFINTAISKYRIKKEVRKNKYIWVTYPKMYDFVKVYLTSEHVLIYDCMDDALEFPSVKKNDKKRKELFTLEKELCMRSNIIFASAEHLKNKLINRYKIKNNIYVVNNGIHLTETINELSKLPDTIDRYFNSDKVKLTYIGTIAEWIDFEIILESLNKFENIEYIFVGYNDTKIPSHKRIKYIGPVEHKYVFSIMENSDVLIMPFILNDLILSVNPVKVYEYIYSCKPALVKKYRETMQFEDYVCLYETKDEYFKFIHDVVTSNYTPKHSNEECVQYARNNTWEHRTQKMAEYLSTFTLGHLSSPQQFPSSPENPGNQQV